MLNGRDNGDAIPLPIVVPPQPAPVPSPIATPPPVPPQAPQVVPQTETLQQAEAAVLALVASGLTGAEALAQHPLPAGTSTADALAFLAQLPQTTYQIDNVDSGVVTGPPVAELIDDGPFPDPEADYTAYDGFDYEPFIPEGGGESVSNADVKILRGNGFVSTTRTICAQFGIDPVAAFTIALDAGLSGGIGDGGFAYGPWQLRLTEDTVQQFNGLPPYNVIVQGWSWTKNGIEFAIRSMKAAGASGKKGHAAIHAIVYGWKNIPNTDAAYKERTTLYDNLIAKGDNLNSYIAAIADGPTVGSVTGPGGTAVDIPSGAKPVADVPTINAWKDLTHFLAREMPFAASHTQTIADEFVGLLK